MNQFRLSLVLLFSLFLMQPVFAQIAKPTPEGPYSVRVESDVMVPMRDGVRLATDIYIPVGLSGKLPAVMIRMPYNKTKQYAVDAATWYASNGYRVLVQDMRGKWNSEGIYRVLGDDAHDGYDFINWIITQPWSAGVVGSYGCSYLGENQIILAAEKHPAHRAMIAQGAGGGVGRLGGRYGHFGSFEGGVLGLAAGFGWFPYAGTKNKTDMKVVPENISEALWGLPVVDLMDTHGVGPTDWRAFVSTPLRDPWWDEQGYVNDNDTFDVPTLHVNSWYDYGVSETLQLFNRFRETAQSDRARNGQYALISPATHCGSEKATENFVVGEVNVGDARFPYWDTYLKWFDYWLKGEDNKITAMPKVQYFLTGAGDWREANQWPPAAARKQTFYLSSRKGANSSSGDGSLADTVPVKPRYDKFTYDPGNPVPSKGGGVCCTGNPEDQPGIFDQSDIELRNDVLVYTSPVLDEGLTLTGPVRLVLHVGSSAKDTDFTAKLVDLQPDGKAYNIQDAIFRARFREGIDKEVMMSRGEVYRLDISLHDTAYHLKPGHQLRLEVSSSNFPRFARNLNTGGNNYDEAKWVVAKNRVYHGPNYLSYLEVTTAE